MHPCFQPGPAVITGWIRRIRKPVRAAVAAAFLAGLVVYGYAIANITLCTGDALHNAIFDGTLIWIGRWSSQWLSALSMD